MDEGSVRSDAQKPPKGHLEERLEELRSDLVRLVDRIDENQPTMEEPLVEAPTVPRELRKAEQLLVALEQEIERVDLLLGEVAARERELRLRGFQELGAPYRSEEFTLYARLVPVKGGETLVKYFFSEDPPLNAVAVPLPDGYEVEIDPKSGKRSLRRKKEPSKV